MTKPTLAQKRTPSTHYSITFTSQTPAVTLLKDGLMLGHSGSTADTIPGEHEVVATAPGYVTRVLKFFIPKESLQNNFVFELAKGDDQERQNFQQTSEEINTNLLTTASKRFANFTQLRRYAMLPTILFEDAPGSQPLAIGSTEVPVAELENSFALNPGDLPSAFSLMEASLQKGDCRRVLQIFDEFKTYKNQKSAPMFLSVGHCFEASGQLNKANEFYQFVAAKLPAGHYHKARLARDRMQDIKSFQSLSVTCIKEHPTYFPCYENLIQLFDNPKPELAKKFRTLYDNNISKKLGDPKNILNFSDEQAKYLARELAYSLEAKLLSLQSNEINTHDNIIEKATISSKSHLEPLFKARGSHLSEIKKTHAMTYLYEHNPKQTIQEFVKLLQQIKKSDGCGKALAYLEATPHPTAQSSVGVTAFRGACALDSGEYAKAKELFLKLQKIRPESWRPYWNLAITYEKLGHHEEALSALETALASNIPEEKLNRGQEMLKFLQDKIASKNQGVIK